MDFVLCRWRTDNESSATCLHKIIREEEMADKILIVEDEEKIARFVELELMHEGYEVDKAFDGRTGLDKALTGNYSLIILDIMLPKLNGLEVLRRVRKEYQTDAGADDYLTKPFAIEELLARIRVALKRKNIVEFETRKMTIGDVTLDVDRHEVSVKGEQVELTNREFELLHVLMENKGIVMDREKLINQVCGYDFVGETNTIDVYIRYLRAKIDDRYGIKLISTVRGVGYVIKG